MEETWVFGHMESINDIWNLISERLCHIITDFVPQSLHVHSYRKPWMTKKPLIRKGGPGLS